MKTKVARYLRDASHGLENAARKTEAINEAQEEFNSEAKCIEEALNFQVLPTYSEVPIWQRLVATPDAEVNKNARSDGLVEFEIQDTSDNNEICLATTRIERLDLAGAADPGDQDKRILDPITNEFLDTYDFRETTQQYPTKVLVMQPNRFIIFPYPSPATVNCNLHVEFRRTHLDLSADADISLIPTDYHIALCRRAAALIMEWHVMFEEAAPHNDYFYAKVAHAVNEYKIRSAKPEPRISTRYY